MSYPLSTKGLAETADVFVGKTANKRTEVMIIVYGFCHRLFTFRHIKATENGGIEGECTCNFGRKITKRAGEGLEFPNLSIYLFVNRYPENVVIDN